MVRVSVTIIVMPLLVRKRCDWLLLGFALVEDASPDWKGGSVRQALTLAVTTGKLQLQRFAVAKRTVAACKRVLLSQQKNVAASFAATTLRGSFVAAELALSLHKQPSVFDFFCLFVLAVFVVVVVVFCGCKSKVVAAAESRVSGNVR